MLAFLENKKFYLILKTKIYSSKMCYTVIYIYTYIHIYTFHCCLYVCYVTLYFLYSTQYN